MGDAEFRHAALAFAVERANHDGPTADAATVVAQAEIFRQFLAGETKA